jgi:hypothetical protein
MFSCVGSSSFKQRSITEASWSMSLATRFLPDDLGPAGRTADNEEVEISGAEGYFIIIVSFSQTSLDV